MFLQAIDVHISPFGPLRNGHSAVRAPGRRRGLSLLSVSSVSCVLQTHEYPPSRQTVARLPTLHSLDPVQRRFSDEESATGSSSDRRCSDEARTRHYQMLFEREREREKQANNRRGETPRSGPTRSNFPGLFVGERNTLDLPAIPGSLM
jgi:hypothetical protein